jgi:hypothetical protein
MKCTNKGCKEEAVMKALWPGGKTVYSRAIHYAMALNVLPAIGYHLQFTPVLPDKREEAK